MINIVSVYEHTDDVRHVAEEAIRRGGTPLLSEPIVGDLLKNFRAHSTVLSVLRWTGRTDEPISTINSRFYRRGAPSPKTLLDTLRLALAARLIFEGRLITDIAEAMRFTGTSHLARWHRRLTGESPTASTVTPGRADQLLRNVIQVQVSAWTYDLHRSDR